MRARTGLIRVINILKANIYNLQLAVCYNRGFKSHAVQNSQRNYGSGGSPVFAKWDKSGKSLVVE